MLQITNLNFDYSDKPLLRDVSFSVAEKAILHLRGSNGAGKTTLLKLLAGLLQPKAGEIHYDEQLISQDMSAYQRQICYVGHKTGISSALTVEENCRFELQRENDLDFAQALQRFALSGLEKTRCGLLSMGQRRRVGLLRLLMSDAKLWLLDEPFVALDEKATQALASCMIEHVDKGGLIVLTSHQALPDVLQNHQEYRLC